MKITFEIDTGHDRACEVNKNDYRAAAAFLLHLVGDLDGADETTTETTRLGDAEHIVTTTRREFFTPPPVPSAATAPATVSSVAPVVANVPPPPAIVPPVTVSNIPPPPLVPTGDNGDDGEPSADRGNVVNFPTPPPPPPPPPANTAVVVGAPVASLAPVVVVAPNVASAIVNGPSGVDSAGMQYDARIHQKTGNKKKDGTWKLIKGIDPTIVATVTAELAATKAAAPASGTVLLPSGIQPPGPTSGVMPMPPPPPIAAPISMPASPATSTVPVPPVAAIGGMGAFRDLVDNILTPATKEGKLTPQDVSRLCQHHGAPNLMQLNSMPDLVPKVTASIKAVLAGLSVDAVIAGLG